MNKDKAILEGLNRDLNELNIKIALAKNDLSKDNKIIAQHLKENLGDAQSLFVTNIESAFYKRKED